MSDSEESSTPSHSGSDSSSEGSPTMLDPTSNCFKPLRVLYSRKATRAVPVPEAKLHDNVGQFESCFKQLGGFDQQYSAERMKQIQQERAANSKRAQMQMPSSSWTEMPQRRFLPHQGMIKAEKPARFKRNILMKLENTDGPLKLLLGWMRERIRVKVYTRKESGVRGFVTGFVEAFDKHWNMALVDVYESWKRRKYHYSENKLCTLGEPQDCSEVLRKMGIQVPEISVQSAGRKYVMCSRKVPKLLIRGEQVVLVTRENSVDVKKEKEEQ
ncbi:U7 snRNA-associated Sm-like protein LSm11 [Armigeres subalbatus]|uniref:U7 snRNA-associated Sm-like protein LSm11 n=1 Tax=Armigeres subalbatus TaxID=124917 RepID=UPI002ED2F06F